MNVGLESLGHEVHKIGVISDLQKIRDALDEVQPHITFNLLEEFHHEPLYDQHVVSYLELLKQPYTGCNPRGLTLSHDKALFKKILMYHRIPTPAFFVAPIGRRVVKPKRMEFPLVVKSVSEDASFGIAQASVVTSEAKLKERVEFVHTSIGTDALVEQYIDGRELYVGMIGNNRLELLPIWELSFGKLAEGAPAIATASVKWSAKHQDKIGVETGPAKKLSEALENQIKHICKRAYRVTGFTGYARLDLRLSKDGKPYILEGNANPDICSGEDFAMAAEHAGYTYGALLQKIINQGLRYGKERYV